MRLLQGFMVMMVLLCAHILNAQVKVSAIVEPVEIGGDTTDIYERYSFPHIESSNTVVANKINEHLLLNALNIDSVRESIFEMARGNEKSPVHPLSFTLFEIVHNNKNVLSIDVTSEFCGAYCETGTLHYNYDTRTGSAISFASLLTDEGLHAINDSLVKWKRLEIAEQIRLLHNTKPVNEEDSIRSIEAIEMYNYCLEGFTEAYFGETDYQKYSITAIGFIIYQSRCSAHVNQALDDLGEFDYRVSFKEYGKYLSPYGKVLLAGRY